MAWKARNVLGWSLQCLEGTSFFVAGCTEAEPLSSSPCALQATGRRSIRAPHLGVWLCPELSQVFTRSGGCCHPAVVFLSSQRDRGKEKDPAASIRVARIPLGPPALARSPILTGNVRIPHPRGCLASWQPFSIQPQLRSPIWAISCSAEPTTKFLRVLFLLGNHMFSHRERDDPFARALRRGQWSTFRPHQPALGCK